MNPDTSEPSAERQAFEQALGELHPSWTFDDDGTGGYHNPRTEAAWQGWQAKAGAKESQPVARVDEAGLIRWLIDQEAYLALRGSTLYTHSRAEAPVGPASSITDAHEVAGTETSRAPRESSSKGQLRPDSPQGTDDGQRCKAVGDARSATAHPTSCASVIPAAQEKSVQPADERGAFEAFAALGQWVLSETRDEYIGSDLSGGDIQDKAEALGLLVRVEVTEPCGGNCNCAEYDGFPQECLRFSDAARAAIAPKEQT